MKLSQQGHLRSYAVEGNCNPQQQPSANHSFLKLVLYHSCTKKCKFLSRFIEIPFYISAIF